LDEIDLLTTDHDWENEPQVQIFGVRPESTPKLACLSNQSAAKSFLLVASHDILVNKFLWRFIQASGNAKDYVSNNTSRIVILFLIS
jgi:hypothetical protein